jgi:endonuclease G, mitochondrial
MLKSRWLFYLLLILLCGGLGTALWWQAPVQVTQPTSPPGGQPPGSPPLAAKGALHLTLGNPSQASTAAHNYLLQRSQYALSYNNTKHIPNWVSWQLNLLWLGNVPRSDDFRPDEALPTGWYRVKATDYNNSGFDRGHLTPAADRSDTVANNSATFLMTNILPQAPDLNRGPWEKLESDCRKLVRSGKELYIIAGGYGDRGSVGQGNARITIPERLWKVVVVLDKRGLGLAGVTVKTRVIAVDMPNIQGIEEMGWKTYQVTARQVEKKTGYNFLANVPQAIQDVIETRIDR